MRRLVSSIVVATAMSSLNLQAGVQGVCVELDRPFKEMARERGVTIDTESPWAQTDAGPMGLKVFLSNYIDGVKPGTKLCVFTHTDGRKKTAFEYKRRYSQFIQTDSQYTTCEDDLGDPTLLFAPGYECSEPLVFTKACLYGSKPAWQAD